MKILIIAANKQIHKQSKYTQQINDETKVTPSARPASDEAVVISIIIIITIIINRYDYSCLLLLVVVLVLVLLLLLLLLLV